MGWQRGACTRRLHVPALAGMRCRWTQQDRKVGSLKVQRWGAGAPWQVPRGSGGLPTRLPGNNTGTPMGYYSYVHVCQACCDEGGLPVEQLGKDNCHIAWIAHRGVSPAAAVGQLAGPTCARAGISGVASPQWWSHARAAGQGGATLRDGDPCRDGPAAVRRSTAAGAEGWMCGMPMAAFMES